MNTTTASASIPASDRIPLPQKAAFSLGIWADYLCTTVMFSTLWMPYFNIGLGIDPAKLGIVLMILQAWNAVLDPVMGNLSDNTRTRWGRRRPFLAAGSFLTAMVYPWLWRPPASLGETGTLLYLGIVGVIFYTCFSCWAMPYYGLQLELTPNYDERTRLSAWMALFGKVCGLVGSWIMAFITGPLFFDPQTGKPDLVHGMKVSSWIIAGLIFIAALMPALFVRERYYRAEARSQSRDPFWQSIRESLKCKPLWLLIGMSFFLVVGNSSVSALGQYVNIYYVCHGDIGMASIIGGLKGSVLVVTGILCIPFYTWLGERLDKKQVVGIMLLVSLVGHFSNLVLLNPHHPYLQIIPGVFESGAISAIWLFVPSMKADIADYDELQTFRRREGALNAFYSWFIKAALTCSMGIGGLVLSLSGFDVKRASEQPTEVLHTMLQLYVGLPILIWGAGLIFVWRYPLDRIQLGAIRQQLEARRGAL